MKADVKTLDAKMAGTVDLSEDVFGLEPRADLLHRMVRYQLAKRRAGTVSTRDRSEITATTAKMYRQKGTGRARHGSANATIASPGSMPPRPYPVAAITTNCLPPAR